MKTEITIYDTTLRDGEQAPGFSMNPNQKLLLASNLQSLKVDIMEIGFPASNEMDYRACKLIAKNIKDVKLSVICRASHSEVDICHEVLPRKVQGRIHLFSPTSDLHIVKKLKSSRLAVVENVTSLIRYAKQRFDDVQIGCEDATRANVDFLSFFIDSCIKAGATTVSIGDTIGCASPWDFEALIMKIKNTVVNLDKAILGVHCHNDLGLAVGNSLAGIKAGARHVECTINGIGERAGNAALEEVVMAIEKLSGFSEYSTRIVKENLFPCSRSLVDLVGVDVQVNKAIVGKNAFQHGSGIHQHGLTVDPSTYELIAGSEVGANNRFFVIGKHSGKYGLLDRLAALNLPVSIDKADKIMAFIKSQDSTALMTDDELIKIAELFRNDEGSVDQPNRFVERI